MEAQQYLTPKQQRFCDEYLIDLNAKQAALRAGYTEGTAGGGSLLANPLIQDYIAEAGRERALKTKLSHEMVLLELAKVAFCNMDNYFHADGRVKKMDEIDIDDKAALSGFDVRVYNDEDDGTSKKKQRLKESIHIRLHSKLRALDLLGKHLALGEGKKKSKENSCFDPDFDFSLYVDPEDLNIVPNYDDDELAEMRRRESEVRGRRAEGGGFAKSDVGSRKFGSLSLYSEEEEPELYDREKQFLKEKKEKDESDNLLIACIVKDTLEQFKDQYDHNDDIAKLPYVHPLQIERAKSLLRKNPLAISPLTP